MKPSLLTLSLLLFAFAFAYSIDEPLLDVNDDPVVPGATYYIAVPDEEDGGIVLGKTGNSSCPVTVLQDDSDFGNLKFSMPTGQNKILTRHALDIEFTEKPNCTESSKWIVYFDEDIERHRVGIGGPKDHPGQQILNGTFRIRPVNGYKLLFCLAQPVPGLPFCFFVGKYTFDHGVQKRLILLEVEYKKIPLTISIFPAGDSHRAIRTVV